MVWCGGEGVCYLLRETVGAGQLGALAASRHRHERREEEARLVLEVRPYRLCDLCEDGTFACGIRDRPRTAALHLGDLLGRLHPQYEELHQLVVDGVYLVTDFLKIRLFAHIASQSSNLSILLRQGYGGQALNPSSTHMAGSHRSSPS